MPRHANLTSIPKKPNQNWSGFYLDCYLKNQKKENGKVLRYSDFNDAVKKVEELYKTQHAIYGIQMTTKGFEIRTGHYIYGQWKGHHLKGNGLACWTLGQPIFVCEEQNSGLVRPIEEESSWSDDYAWEEIEAVGPEVKLHNWVYSWMVKGKLYQVQTDGKIMPWGKDKNETTEDGAYKKWDEYFWDQRGEFEIKNGCRMTAHDLANITNGIEPISENFIQ
jgi:hypothetical protein